MTIKPHVDTVNVEGVIALRQYAGFLVILEFRQANGAFQRREITCFSGVNNSRDRSNDGRIQTLGSTGGGRSSTGSGNREQSLSTTAHVTATDIAEEDTHVAVEAEYGK